MAKPFSTSTWQEALDLRSDGQGWEDIKAKCGLTEAEARLLVFGKEAYMRWAMKRRKAK